MTSPARCFSPADMTPRRPQPEPAKAPAPQPPTATVAESIAPGVLVGKERMRTMVERGMRISRLHPETRLVALTLLSYSNHKSGFIYRRYMPTAEQLAEATGLTDGQVQVQIHVLTQRGWLYSRRIPQGHDAGRTALSFAVPALVLEQVRAARAAAEASDPVRTAEPPTS
jgi:hypothetical protein